MTINELANEKIDKDSLNLTYTTTSNNTRDTRVTVAFRDPGDPENVIAYRLDKEIVADLQSSFSSRDFYQREDGILRLNNKAEEYIAGWVEDIKGNRGYEDADADGDGKINEKESRDLNIAFSRKTDYDYLGEKIVEARTSVNATGYESFAGLSDDKATIVSAKSLKFKNTIEKELRHTLELDKDKDGTITLKEGLEDYTPIGSSVEETFANQIEKDHKKWAKDADIILNEQKVENRELYIKELLDPDAVGYTVYGMNGELIENMTMDEMKEFLGEDYAKNSKLSLEEIIQSTGVFLIDFNDRQKEFPHQMTGNKIIDPSTLNPEEHPDLFTKMTGESFEFDLEAKLKSLDLMV